MLVFTQHTDKTACMVTQKEITHLDKDDQHKKYTDPENPGKFSKTMQKGSFISYNWCKT